MLSEFVTTIEDVKKSYMVIHSSERNNKGYTYTKNILLLKILEYAI